MKVKGQVLEFDWGGNRRQYILGAMPFKDFVANTTEEVFDVATGEGNQRNNDAKRVKYLADTVSNGKYVPDTVHLSVRPERRDALKFKDGQVSLEIDEGDASTHLLNING